MKTAIINHTCGDTTTVQIDSTVRSWVAHYEALPCFVCVPTQEVKHLCEHTTQVPRGFHSPRRMEIAAMQLCPNCQGGIEQ